jgi:hypothetical protein
MTDARKPSPLLELLITLIIPSLVLMKLSGPDDLGPAHALLLALAFPLAWGVHDWNRRKNINLFAALGLVSVLLTGGIGLLRLDNQWLALKEAAIPGLIGLAVLGSTWTRYPLIRTLLFTPSLIDVARVQRHLDARGTAQTFERHLLIATWMLAGTFFFSSAMNYFLATWIVISPAGSPAFNEELGRLALMSYPMIAIPSLLMTLAVLHYLARALHRLTGLKLTETLNHHGEHRDDR